VIDLSIQQLAHASGRVVDESSRPVAGVMVEAVAAELAGFDPPPYQNPVKSNENGVFEFRDLSPGTYVFGVHLTKGGYLHHLTGPAVYLPGTGVANDATVIELKAGDKKEVGTLRLSNR